MSDEVIYEASPWGAKYHSLTHDEALGGGSAGPGKSLILLMDTLTRIRIEHARCEDPDYIPPGMTKPCPLEWGESRGWALHLRRVMPNLENTLVRAKRMFPKIDPGANWNENKATWTFSSGYKVQFGHCKDADDWQQYQSAEFDHIAYDELTQFNEEQYDQINTRLRTSDPVLALQLKIRSMSNPMMDTAGMVGVSVRNPHWVRDRFVKPCPEGGRTLTRTLTMMDGTKRKHRSIYLHALLKHNPDASFRAQYEFNLQSRPPHIRAALLFGDWFMTAGSFYGDVWNKTVHTCDSFKIPDDWPVCRSMDWGFRAPGCVHWGALDPDGILFVFREYTFKGKTSTEVARRIRSIEEDLGLWSGKRSLITGPADTQLWEARGDTGMGKAEEFAAEGVQWVRADKLSRQRNAERIYGRLADHDNYTKPPGLIIFRNRCPMLIQTLPSIQTDPDNENEPLDGGDDHWHDSLGYLCAYVSRGKKGISKKKLKDEWEEDAPKRTGTGGRWGYGR